MSPYLGVLQSCALVCAAFFLPSYYLRTAAKGVGSLVSDAHPSVLRSFCFILECLFTWKITHTQMFLLLVHSPNGCRSGPGQNHQPGASSVLPHGHRGQGLGCFPRHICREARWEVEQWHPIPPLHHRANLWNLVGHFLFPISSVLPVLISSLLFWNCYEVLLKPV